MAHNRFLNAAETLWEAVDLIAPTTGGKHAARLLKRFVTHELNVRSDIPPSHPGHPMYLYGRLTVDASRERLKTAVQTRIQEADSEDMTYLLVTVFEEEGSDAHAKLTQMLRRYRDWRTVLMNGDSDSESD